jgi:hypothetical protein
MTKPLKTSWQVYAWLPNMLLDLNELDPMAM